ncbi:hypothetical protein EUGRSUZ_F00574, partial [Eucalyptus grandis]
MGVSWNKSVDCCSWDEVTWDNVTSNLQVLDMSTCNLTKLPYFLNSLESLTYLNLSHNKISGEILRWFWGISQHTLKHLDLSNNLLEGGIHQLHWKRLLYINLQENSLQGPLPIPSPSTRYFYAMSNGFNGEIPYSICQLSSLLRLALSDNNLSGTVPPCVGNISNLDYLGLSRNILQGPLPIPSPSTRYFYAMNNGFTGEIPSSICQLSSLLRLALSDNNLSGTVPPCVGNISNLDYLGLSRNILQGSLPIPSPSTRYFYAMNNGFTGEIPSSICQLSSLLELALSYNNLLGIVPPCFGNITNLELLNLISNKLQGPLPRSLVKWANLSTLLLGYNGFNDIFPHWLKAPHLHYLGLRSNNFHGRINLIAFELSFPALRYLLISNNNLIGWCPMKVFSNTSLHIIDLSNNKFGVPIPLLSPVTMYYSIANNVITGMIPSLICNATNLEMINLSNNSLIGSLPWCLTNFSTVLSVLNLGMNHLEGTIPQTISLIHRLTTLDLSRNRFEGTLPRSLVNCTNLEILDLSINQIEDTFLAWSNNLKGPLNIRKGDLIFTKLRILDLSNNNFCSPLPANLIMNLEGMKNTEDGRYGPSYMTRYYLSFGSSYENTVTVMMKGRETKLVKILTIFTTIDLSQNLFQGDILEVFGHLRCLIGLNLSHNHLASSIPLTLGNLTNLEWLDLSSNMLIRRIPRALGDLRYLGYLNFSKNQLTGQIPQDKQLSTFLNNSFSGNPGLCGTPLSKACPSDAQSPPPSSSSTLDRGGHESWFKQRVVWIGYASGIVIGISIAYIAIQTGWPKWLARG